jgi:outer membrane protein assembly factor BamB
MKRAFAPALVFVAALELAGCATDGARRAGDMGEVGVALARLRPSGATPVNATGEPTAYLAYRGPSGPELGAFDLARSSLVWRQPGELTGRIEVGRAEIVHAARTPAGATVLVGRSGGTGEVLWRQELPGDQRLIGYAVDGDSAYYVARAFSATGTHGQGSLTALDARTGALRWRHDLPPGDVGAPAARGGLVAVPSATQYVLLHDGGSGAELARILSIEQAASFVRALPEGIFFGSKGVFRASPDTATASRKSEGYAQAALPAFARPIYAPDMYRAEQGDYSAIDRNRVVWRPAADESVGGGVGVGAGALLGGRRMAFRDGLVFVHDFRFFFAIDAASGALRWAHAEKSSDAVASAHTGSALVYVTADGELGALDAATGRPVYRARIPGATMVRGATFDADGFGGAAPGATGAAEPAQASPTLAETLAAILWDSDRRFSDALATYVVDELGKLPGRAVTAELLKAVQAPPAALAAPARKKADEALASRRDPESADLFVAALAVRADYADDTHPTSVASIARAATAMRSKPVALALADHLRRPETAPDTVVQISRALAAAGAVEALPTLRDFLCMYRGEPVFDGDPTALIAVATAILELGGPPDRQLLLFVAEEPRTVEPVRLHLRRALAATPTAAALAAP